MKTKSKRKVRPSRFFVMGTGDVKRVVVFKHGKEPGASYFLDGTIMPAWWTLKEMKDRTEVTRTEALKLFIQLPK